MLEYYHGNVSRIFIATSPRRKTMQRINYNDHEHRVITMADCIADDEEILPRAVLSENFLEEFNSSVGNDMGFSDRGPVACIRNLTASFLFHDITDSAAMISSGPERALVTICYCAIDYIIGPL